MNSIRKRGAVWLLFFSLLFVSFLIGCARAGAPIVGAPARNFPFQYPDGRSGSLSDFRGKPVLVVFWSTWCDVCKSELPELSALHKQLQGNPIVLSVIVRDKKDTAFSFVEKNPVPFPVVFADTKPVVDGYALTGVPEIFLVGKDGNFLPIIDTDGDAKVKVIGAKPWTSDSFFKQLRAAQ